VPIIAWMIWRVDIRWYPALLVSMAIDGYTTYAYLFVSFIVCIKKWSVLKTYPPIIRGLLAFLLIPIPALIAICIRNWSYLSDTPSKAIEPLLMYFGVFPFFFGLLIAREISKRDIWMIMYVCGLLMAMQFIAPSMVDGGGETMSSTIRVIFLTIPVVVCCMAYSWCNQNFLIVNLVSTFLILGYILISAGNTFTILGSALVTCILGFLVKIRFKLVVKCATSVLPFAISIAFVVFVVANFEKYALQSYDRSLSYEELTDQWNWAAIKTRIQMKTYDDRAALWRASWRNVSEPPYWVPEVMVQNVIYETVSGTYVESALSSHNQPLQILRTLRWGLGSFLIIGYVIISILGGRYLRLPLKRDDPLVPIIVATVTVSVIGFTTGHYPLLPTFSLMLMSFMGIGYGCYCQEIQTRKIKRIGASLPTNISVD
jgi:hypothetical protein